MSGIRSIYLFTVMFVSLSAFGQAAPDTTVNGTAVREEVNQVIMDKQEPTDRAEIQKIFGPFVWGWLVVLTLILVPMMYYHRPRDGKESPFLKETLCLPPGTLRGVITFSLVYFVILLEYYKFLYPANLSYFSDKLISGFEIMLGFYFGGKVLQSMSAADTEKSKHVASAAKESIEARKQIEKAKVASANPLSESGAVG